MSIEAALAALTAAVEANTAALKAAGGTATTATAEKTEKVEKAEKTTKAKAEKTVKPTHSRDEMIAALNDVKEAKGVASAKEVIKNVGGVDKMADIPDAKIDAVFDACKEIVGGGDTDEEEGM